MLGYYIFKHIFKTKTKGQNLFSKKRSSEYLDKNYNGFANIFIIAKKR